MAAYGGNIAILHWLLVEGGESISIKSWSTLWILVRPKHIKVAELSLLLKVMVMLNDAPSDFIAKSSPEHAELCERGRQLRAQLPLYLEQQRATIVGHGSLPPVLQSVVAEYAATTPADMWKNGLRVQAPQPKRSREEVAAEEEGKEDGEPRLRRSARLHQKRG
jgi:hypothetical protein